jgi:hypothetical protein
MRVLLLLPSSARSVAAPAGSGRGAPGVLLRVVFASGVVRGLVLSALRQQPLRRDGHNTHTHSAVCVCVCSVAPEGRAWTSAEEVSSGNGESSASAANGSALPITAASAAAQAASAALRRSGAAAGGGGGGAPDAAQRGDAAAGDAAARRGRAVQRARTPGSAAACILRASREGRGREGGGKILEQPAQQAAQHPFAQKRPPRPPSTDERHRTTRHARRFTAQTLHVTKHAPAQRSRPSTRAAPRAHAAQKEIATTAPQTTQPLAHTTRVFTLRCAAPSRPHRRLPAV